MKIRIKFTKEGSMQFIGHLDLMRFFQKAMRRAEVDIRYSEGFHPHQIMSFAAPLGIGMTSEGEYMDIEVLSTESSRKMMERLNAVSNDEIRVVGYRRIPEESKTAMSMIVAADYRVSFSDLGRRTLARGLGLSPESADAGNGRLADPGAFCAKLEEKLAEFCCMESIPVLKQTKKSEKEIDIRPLIYELSLCPETEDIFLRCSAGSEANLKPELVLQAFYEFLGESMPEFALRVHRLELYGKDPGRKGEFLPLSDFGEDIP